jgi:uncharacterized membrane protein
VAEDEAVNPQPGSPTGSARPEDNSIGRLLTLSDGVFAIAMTLLALDLKVPDLGSNATDAQLRHALAQNTATYWSFLLTFYVIAVYWGEHRRLMRSVVATHPTLIRDTIFLLLIVAAMPFPASLLGRYGGTPFALSLYGAANALATIATMVLAHDVRVHSLAGRDTDPSRGNSRQWQNWLNLAVFLLCIPAGYVVGDNGPFVLVLLVVPNRPPMLNKLAHRAGLNTLWARFFHGHGSKASDNNLCDP